MHQTRSLYGLLRLAVLVTGQTATYSLGDAAQYTKTTGAVPSLTGAVISYSGGTTPDEGVDVFISPDLRASLEETLNTKCQQANDECFQGIRDLTSGPHAELEARNPLLILAFVLGIVGIIIPSIHFASSDNKVPEHIFVPPPQVTQALEATAALVTVASIADIPPFTITLKPEPTTITGAQTPAVTTFASAVEGHNQGDVLISIPADLAVRMDEFVRRTTSCTAGTTFNQNLRKRADDFGSILCAAQGLVMNAVPGGAFSDIRLLRPQPLPFTITDAIRAMNAAMDFARSYAPALQLDIADAAAVGTIAFALAWDVWYADSPLGAENIIPAAMLGGNITSAPLPTTTSSTGCSACYASCSFAGAIQRCGTTCSPQTSCSSSVGDEVSVSTTAITLWTVYPRAAAIPEGPSDCTITSVVYPEGMDSVTTIGTIPVPQVALSGTYRHCICGETSIAIELATSGTSTITYCHSSGATLPPGFTDIPVVNGLPFTAPNPVSATPTPTPPPPPPAPTLGPQQCHGPDDFGKHKDIQSGTQDKWAKAVCEADLLFTPETPARLWNPWGISKVEPYHYSISWIKGCQTTEASQSILNPLPGVMCYALLRGDFKNCNNGGVGGFIDAGCLRYEFSASLT